MKRLNLLPKVVVMGTIALISAGISELSVNAAQEKLINYSEVFNNDAKSLLEKNAEPIDQTKPIDIVAKNFDSTQIVSTEDVVTIVYNWTDFATAFMNNNVTHIELANDIAYGTGGSDAIPSKSRKTSLVIDGNNHSISMDLQRLQLDSAAEGQPEITVENFSNVILSYMAYHEGFVYASMSYWRSTRNSTWTINFSNIQNQSGQTSRIADNSGGQVNFTGNVLWYCEQELMTTSGVNISEGVNVSSYKKNNGQQSFIWFDRPPRYKKDTDAGTDDIVLEKNASLNLKLDGSGTWYPAVFSFYKNFKLKEGATYNATMPGAAYRADYEASNFHADGNNKINLTSTANGFAPISFTTLNDRLNSNNTTDQREFYVGPGSEFYVIAKTNNSLFDTTPPSPASGIYIGNLVNITIDTPKYLDLRNSSGTKTDKSSILEEKSGVGNFSILNSDLNIWKISDDVSSPASHSFSAVEKLTQSGRKSDKNLEYSSTESGVTELLPLSTISRISALNENPTLNFIDVTNAQKSISYETVLGQFPDEKGMNDDGSINYENVYPEKGAATAEVTDTNGIVHEGVPSGENGITTVALNEFNQAGEYTSGIAIYGKRTQEEPTTYKVWDVVPPEPAVVTSTDLTEGISSLSGTGEADATVYLKIDGETIDIGDTKVDSDGKWTLKFDATLAKVGSTAQIFLEDNAGKADITNPPATNNERGNINPETDLIYQDAMFKAATKVTFTKSNFTIKAKAFSIHAKDYPKTDDELKTLILKDSEAKLTNADTNEELDASNLLVDISKLPSTSSGTINKGSYNVILSYKRGDSTFTKEIKITILTSSKMLMKQVYTGTDQPIYSDLKNKILVDNTKTIEVGSGDQIEEIINNQISEKNLTLNYEGYNNHIVTDYRIYENGKEIVPTPTTAPYDDFTIVYEYEGQLKFDKVAEKMDFGSIDLSNGKSSNALTEDSDQIITVINTVPDGIWTLKASLPEGIKGSDDNRTFLGNLIYINESGSEQTISKSAIKIETNTDDTLYKELKIKNNSTGLFLQQNGGNLKGKYSGELVWLLEDAP